MQINELAPSLKTRLLSETLNDEFLNQDRMECFSKAAVEFLDQLSSNLRAMPGIAQEPELASLGFWLRNSHLTEIIEAFKKTVPANIVLSARGLAFHVAPANVDALFVYSWTLSLIAGNLNIIRLSQKQGASLNKLLEKIRETLADYPEISKKNLLLTYPHTDDINRAFSQAADIRILWGGDSTIQYFRALPAKPAAKDIPFADKTSLCIIRSAAYLKLGEKQKGELAHQFFNDAYWFAQQACASPKIVYFSGTEKNCIQSSLQFWKLIESELENKAIKDSEGAAMDKLAGAYEVLIAANKKVLAPKAFQSGKPVVLRVDSSECRNFGEGPSGGFFLECFIPELSALKPLIRSKDQSLGYFGYAPEEMAGFLKSLQGRGIERAVPIGEALAFYPVWDGYDLLRELTRHIVVK